MQDHARPYWAKHGHTGPKGTIRDQMALYRTIQDRKEPYWTIQDNTGPYRNIPDYTGPQGAIIGYYKRLYGTIRDLKVS